MSVVLKASNGTVMEKKLLRVLFVEDSLADAFLLERALTRGGFRVVSERVDTAEQMSRALAEREWDLILCDHSMPQFSSPAALRILQEKKLDLPFIIVSGHIEEEMAVSTMDSGAHDYIMKDRLARLVPAVERELREAEVRRARAKSEEELRRAQEELELRVEQRTAALKEANQKLRDVLEERKRLEAELLEIAENERRRIGFDLHDDLGQKLTGLLLISRALEQRLTREGHKETEEVRRICELIEQSVLHTHNLAHHFSSIDATGGDLGEVMNGLAATVEKMFSIPCQCTIKGEIPSLPENSGAQFYKIAQEAISNAIKHGKASCVWISITANSQKLVVTIKNDGVPFSPPANPKARMGLRTMNYRANTIGATFDIKPNQKNGTIVTCVLPLKNFPKLSHQAPNGSNGSHSASEAAKSAPAMKRSDDPEKVLA
jgi:signal transduction histidine kinase